MRAKLVGLFKLAARYNKCGDKTKWGTFSSGGFPDKVEAPGRLANLTFFLKTFLHFLQANTISVAFANL